ncbi:MAG: proline--tRNA ligase [Candidatus Diapherotrites archaeon]
MCAKKEEEQQLGLTVKKEEDFSEWYNQIVLKAELADYGPVRGFMIIRPRAYAMWESIQDFFNARIKEHGVMNGYFPLLIPESFFKKEAEHAEGFAPELAWIESKDDTEERVAIRPTSETIMYDAYSKWIRSHRDLPLRINQWCNVLRWEVKQTKLFLRTREFLWQEGHCVYATKEECDTEVKMFLGEYKKLCEELLAIPVLGGMKSKYETFPGAYYTLTLEALMPDGKALQMGTSHNLGQGFAKAFGIKFIGEDSTEQLPWQSSWGFSTRLIGATVMSHSDDKGLILPPKLAYNKIVIVPIIFEKTKDKVLKETEKISKKLKKFNPIFDNRETHSAGWKFNEWELKGIPIRVEIGPKDLEKKQAVIVRRDTGKKKFVKISDLEKEIEKELETMQKDLFKKAKKFLDENTAEVTSWDKFTQAIKDKKFVLAYFCMNEQCEETIKDETTATSRCIPFSQKCNEGKCIKCGKPAKEKAYFAKSY